MLKLAFHCPLCAEPFQALAAHQGQAVACPHCKGAVAIPAAMSHREGGDDPPDHVHPPVADSRNGTGQPSAPTIPTRSMDREPPPLRRAVVDDDRAPPRERPILVQERTKTIVHLDGEAYEVRSLTPEERTAFRRRVNLMVFSVTAVLLALMVVALLVWRG